MLNWEKYSAMIAAIAVLCSVAIAAAIYYQTKEIAMTQGKVIKAEALATFLPFIDGSSSECEQEKVKYALEKIAEFSDENEAEKLKELFFLEKWNQWGQTRLI